MSQLHKLLATKDEQYRELMKQLNALKTQLSGVAQNLPGGTNNDVANNNKKSMAPSALDDTMGEDMADWSVEAAGGSTQHEANNNLTAGAAGGSAQHKNMYNVAFPAAMSSKGAIKKTVAKANVNSVNTSVGEGLNTEHANNQGETDADGVIKGKASPPMIKIFNVNVRDFTCKLKGEIGNDLFSITVINKNLIGLKLARAEDYAKTKLFLERDKVSFYTFTPKGLKPRTLIVRGLSDTYDEKDLQGFIDEHQTSVRVERITKIGGGRFILQMSGDSDEKAFRKLRYILNTRVKIGRHKRKGLIQCRNCQRFGHISTNCRMPYRCVKCGQSHGPKNCSIPSREANIEETLTTNPVTGEITRVRGRPVRCVNCDNDGHVASSKECPKRIELVQRMEERKLSAIESRSSRGPRNIITTNTPMVSASGATYANMARDTVQVPNNNPAAFSGQITQTMGMFNQECKRLLGKDFYTCMQRIGAFADEFRKLKTDAERTNALFGIMATLKLHD